MEDDIDMMTLVNALLCIPGTENVVKEASVPATSGVAPRCNSQCLEYSVSF